MNIEPQKFYRPSEIVENGWILNSRNKVGESSINYVRKLIRKGSLRASNYAGGEKGMNYWKVLGSEVVRYKREVEGVEIETQGIQDPSG